MTRIQHRRGTAAQWTTANPVLASGELGFETDTDKFKMGDGVNAWTVLAYFTDQTYNDLRYALIGEGGGTFSGNADDLSDGATKVVMTTLEREKLQSIDPGATANLDDAYLLNLGNSTGSIGTDQVNGLDEALLTVPDKNGSITQFQDVSDTAATDGQMYIKDAETNQLIPFTPTDLFAVLDANTGRLAQFNEPIDFHPIKILDAGATPPAGTRLDTIIFEKNAVASKIPQYLDDNVAQASTTNILTTPQALTVGTDIGIGIYASNEAGGFTSVTAAYSTGAGAVTFATWSMPSTTAAISTAIARITTNVPSGATITLTMRDSGGVALSRVHSIAILFLTPGLSATGIDQQVNSGGNSSTNLLSLTTGPTPFDTVQANEVAIATVAWNSLVSPGTRTLAATYSGWTKIGEVKSDNGGSARSLAVFYKLLDTIQKPAFVSSMTSSDGSTGQWATQVITLRTVA